MERSQLVPFDGRQLPRIEGFELTFHSTIPQTRISALEGGERCGKNVDGSCNSQENSETEYEMCDDNDDYKQPSKQDVGNEPLLPHKFRVDATSNPHCREEDFQNCKREGVQPKCLEVTTNAAPCDNLGEMVPESKRKLRSHSIRANAEEIAPTVRMGRTLDSKLKEKKGRATQSEFIQKDKTVDSKSKLSNDSSDARKRKSVRTLERELKEKTDRTIQSELIQKKGKSIHSKSKRSNHSPDPSKGESVRTLKSRISIRKPKCGHTSQDASNKLKPDMNTVGTHFPTFVVEMKHSNVIAGFWLVIPAEFSHKHLPTENESITLQDAQGLKWEAKYLVRKNALSAGWRRFVMDHRLEIGDVAVFELIKPMEFLVHITGGSHGNKAQPAANASKKAPDSNSSPAIFSAKKRMKIDISTQDKVPVQKQVTTRSSKKVNVHSLS